MVVLASTSPVCPGYNCYFSFSCQKWNTVNSVDAVHETVGACVFGQVLSCAHTIRVEPYGCIPKSCNFTICALMDEGSENVLFRLYNLSMFFLALCLKVYQQNSRVYPNLHVRWGKAPILCFPSWLFGMKSRIYSVCRWKNSYGIKKLWSFVRLFGENFGS